LRIIGRARRDHLLRVRLPQLRRRILGSPYDGHLVVVDRHWRNRAADLQVGDRIVLPAGAEIEGSCAEVIDRRTSLTIAEAVRSGLGRAAVSDWSTFVRVSRKAYNGRARFRFDEEKDGDSGD
jgi:hypothetical protein